MVPGQLPWRLGKVGGRVLERFRRITGRLHQGSKEGFKEGPGQFRNKVVYKRLVQ